jgi:hypothetical protein
MATRTKETRERESAAGLSALNVVRLQIITLDTRRDKTPWHSTSSRT